MNEEQNGEIKQVTKVKNPGRQKSGYKLVEWNRKNKEDLQKEPETRTYQFPIKCRTK